jgi:hypothetical protein
MNAQGGIGKIKAVKLRYVAFNRRRRKKGNPNPNV